MMKMKVEIWSDVMCPFCYIGKRKFEKALEQFDQHDQVEVVWKSFQLNPQLTTQPGKSLNQYLSETKGWSLEQAEQMNERVTQMAREEGLDYHLEKAVVANSFDAHRLVQFAKQSGKGDAAEEALFRAYFTEGKNTADHAVLSALGESIGLDKNEVEQVLNSERFSQEVKTDIAESAQLGIRGVPFFVIDRKYGISGAQPSQVFADALRQSFSEWTLSKKDPLTDLTTEGDSCSPEGCE
jgi:predicted DsbA family dithiol-disulfide isomerase